MLRASNAIDLHYGAAQALRGGVARGRAGQGDLRARPQRRRQDQPAATRWPASIRSATAAIALRGADITRLTPHERARRGIAYVPQGREIFPLLTVEENLRDRLCAAAARGRAPSRTTCSRCFPVLERDAAPARRRPFRRPAAAARDRPRAGHAAAAAAARRADRGHPALDHQGYRPRHRLFAQSRPDRRSCWSSNISTSRASSATISPSWTAAPSSILAAATSMDEAALKRAMAM